MRPRRRHSATSLPPTPLGSPSSRNRRSSPGCRSSIRITISGSAPATTTCSTTCWPTPGPATTSSPRCSSTAIRCIARPARRSCAASARPNSPPAWRRCAPADSTATCGPVRRRYHRQGREEVSGSKGRAAGLDGAGADEPVEVAGRGRWPKLEGQEGPGGGRAAGELQFVAHRQPERNRGDPSRSPFSLARGIRAPVALAFCYASGMKFFFLDDSRYYRNCSRPRVGSLVAVGGVILDAAATALQLTKAEEGNYGGDSSTLRS